jgi:GNAT superfamily N-acetyltransferase
VAQVEIVAVQDRQSSHEFLEFPYAHYRGDPCWVPPLRVSQKILFDPHRHPFHRHAEMQRFLARRGGRPVGRVAAIQDPNYDRFHGEPFGFFGFFESVNDQEVADALLGAAREWLTGRGARTILGPVNPSTNYECGLLVEGFDSSPFVMMTYNPPWYAGLLERAGLRKAKDLYAYTANPGTVELSKIERVAGKALRDTQVRIRPIRMKEFPAEVERIWAVYNSAWSRNWGFVPMTREEFFFTADEMKPLVVPEFLLLGEVGERTVGFALSLPDINQALIHAGGRLFPLGLLKILYHQRHIKSLRVIALGVIGEFLSAGIGAAFYAALVREAARLGYRDCELSWVLEDNVLMKRSMETLGARRCKIYRIYQWA